MSLLLDAGHAYAGDYPVGRVWTEARIVVARINRNHRTTTTLLKAAIDSAFSKPGVRELNKLLEKLDPGD